MSDVPALYTRNLALVGEVAASWFLPGADREDVLQEARVALWLACRGWDSERGPFKPYARMCMHAACRDALRAAGRRKHAVLTGAARDDVLAFVPGQEAEPGKAADVLAQLSPAEARAVVGRACGLAYEEIGDPKTVDNALQRARAKIVRQAG